MNAFGRDLYMTTFIGTAVMTGIAAGFVIASAIDDIRTRKVYRNEYMKNQAAIYKLIDKIENYYGD